MDKATQKEHQHSSLGKNAVLVLLRRIPHNTRMCGAAVPGTAICFVCFSEKMNKISVWSADSNSTHIVTDVKEMPSLSVTYRAFLSQNYSGYHLKNNNKKKLWQKQLWQNGYCFSRKCGYCGVTRQWRHSKGTNDRVFWQKRFFCNETPWWER